MATIYKDDSLPTILFTNTPVVDNKRLAKSPDMVTTKEEDTSKTEDIEELWKQFVGDVNLPECTCFLSFFCRYWLILV